MEENLGGRIGQGLRRTTILNLQDDLIQDLQDDIKKLKKRTILLNNVPLNRLKGI